jgi:hypothetical protein
MIAGPRSSAKIKSPWAKRTVNAAKSILSCSHKAGVVGVYNRSAYDNEKRAALDALSNYVMGRGEGGTPAAILNARRCRVVPPAPHGNPDARRLIDVMVAASHSFGRY